jgi:hypothetical protein
VFIIHSVYNDKFHRKAFARGGESRWSFYTSMLKLFFHEKWICIIAIKTLQWCYSSNNESEFPKVTQPLPIYTLSLLFAGIEWPSGAFGLLRPKSGCPGDKKRGWNEGWRLQDMEDDAKSSTRRSKVSSGSHMDVTLIGGKKNINRTFCMRMEQNTGNRKGNWPNGRFIHTDCNRNKNYYR